MAITDPFPLDILEKIDSPELTAWLAQHGRDKYANAEDINKILIALQYLYENIGSGGGSTQNLQGVTTGDGNNETTNDLVVKDATGTKRAIVDVADFTAVHFGDNKRTSLDPDGIRFGKPDGSPGYTRLKFLLGILTGEVQIPNFAGVKTMAFLDDIPTIPTELSQLGQDANHRVVTDTEKDYWNSKQEALTIDGYANIGSPNPISGNAVATEVEILNSNLGLKLDKSFILYNTMLTPIRSNAGLTIVGITGANTESLGNTLRNYASTNKFSTMNRLGYVTSAVAGNIAYFRQITDVVNILYPFESFISFGKGVNVNGQRSVFGFINNYSSPSNSEATTLLNSFGVCELSTSNNWHIFHNDGTGLANVIDLGSNFPCRNTNTDVVNAYFKNIPGGGLYYEIECNGNIVNGLIETDLPTSSASLTYKWWTTNNATALSCSIELFKFILNQNLQ